MNTLTENLVVTYMPIVCCSCGLRFFVPEHWYNERVQKQDKFYCPNNHGQNFCGEKEEDRLKRRLTSAENDLEGKCRIIGHLERSRSTLRGQITKLKKKIKGG